MEEPDADAGEGDNYGFVQDVQGQEASHRIRC